MNQVEAKRSYTFWWIFQRFSGVVLLITLLGHMFIVHFSLVEFKAVPLRPEDVAGRFNDPGMKLFYALFLLMAIPHGINGVLNAVDDYVRHDGLRLALTWAAWLLGLMVFIWGMFSLV